MDENTTTLTAQHPEHCHACYRIIHPGETYHQTAENTALCPECADKDASISDTPNPWEVRTLPGDVHLEMWGGDVPALVMAQGENRIRVELAHVKGLVAGLVDAAADLAEVLAAGGSYHA
jgi:hypothetical protein